MIEAIVAAVGLVVCWFLAMAANLEGEKSLSTYGFLVAVGICALYFLVRIIHWAWITPIPFVDRIGH